MVKTRNCYGILVLMMLLLFTISACGYNKQTSQLPIEINNWSASLDGDILIDTGPRYDNLTEYASIYISGNSGFVSHASSGNGTEVNPYIIEGLNITNSATPLTIRYTTSYAIIRDCLISGMGTANDGITLYDADNIVIEYTKVMDIRYNAIKLERTQFVKINNAEVVNNAGWAGILLYYAVNCMVIDSIVHDTDGSGIVSDSSQNILLSGNYAHHNAHPGIRFQQSSDSIASGNKAYSNKEDGIWAFEGNSNITIQSNTVFDNAGSGISLRQSDYSKVLDNNITMNKVHGISLDNSHENKISNNTIVSNQYQGIGFGDENVSNGNLIQSNSIMENERGIYLRGSDNVVQDNAIIENSNWGIHIYKDGNSISRNIFYLNARGVLFDLDSTSNSFEKNSLIRNIEQIVDNGESNTIDSNYYDEWRGDSNNDAVVDDVYEIYSNDGLSNQDDYPQTMPQHDHPVTYLGNPYLLVSIPLSISGVLDISWLPSNYADDSAPLYSIFIDNNSMIVNILDNSSLTEYSWDSTTLSNGDYTLKMRVSTDSYSISISLGLIEINNPPETSNDSSISSETDPELNFSSLSMLSALVLIGYQSYRSRKSQKQSK